MFLNPYLFEILFNNYNNYNLDIIEFTVYYQIEEKNKIFYPDDKLNHNHNFSNKFIYQPELSNILFYEPRSKNYSKIICRTVWSKLFKRKIMLKAINYIGNDYYKNRYIIVVEDTILNVILFHFAKNYTNINLPGYMYNKRILSISRINPTIELAKKRSISFLLYYKLLYRYLKEMNKDMNYLYYDMKEFGFELISLKKYNIKEYLLIAKEMFKEIINNNKISEEFKCFIKSEYKLLLF